MRISQRTLDASITVDQLLAEINAAKEAGLVNGSTKVIMGQMLLHNTWPVCSVYATDKGSSMPFLAVCLEREQEFIDDGFKPVIDKLT